MAYHIYISGAADHLAEELDAASLADQPEKIRQIAQAVDAANDIWKGWCLSIGGEPLSFSGASFKLRIPAEKVNEIEGLQDQYADALDTTVSVGVGARLSEADKTLKAVQASGGDGIRLYDRSVDEDLSSLGELSKAESSEANTNPPVPPAQEPQSPEPTEKPADFHEQLGQLAQQQEMADQQEAAKKAQEVQSNEIKQSVVSVLQVFKARAQELEGLKEQDPELYQGLVTMVRAMTAMAQEATQAESMQKNESFQALIKKDLMPGGKGDDQPDSKFIKDQLEIGIRTEMEEHGLDFQRAKEVAKDHLMEDAHYYSKLEKGDVVPFNPPPPTGKKFRSKAAVTPIPTAANLRYEDEKQAIDPEARNRAMRGTVPETTDPTLSVRGISGKNIYDYSHLLSPESQALGHRMYVKHGLGQHDDYMHAEILDKEGNRVNAGWAYPRTGPGADQPPGAISRALQAHSNWILYHNKTKKSEQDENEVLEKGWPKNDQENAENARGFLNNPVAQDAYMEQVGAAIEEGDFNDRLSEKPPDYTNPGTWAAHVHNLEASRNPATPTKLPHQKPLFDVYGSPQSPLRPSPADLEHERDYWQDTEAQAKGVSLAELRRRASKKKMAKTGLDPGKTGRHIVKLPPGSQLDPGPQSTRGNSGKVVVDVVANQLTGDKKKVRRSTRAGRIMAADGSTTSSRNPNPQSSEPARLEDSLGKAWPRDEYENQANAAAHAVMEDALMEHGAVPKEHGVSVNVAAKLPRKTGKQYSFTETPEEIDPVLGVSEGNIAHGLQEVRRYNFRQNPLSANFEPASEYNEAGHGISRPIDEGRPRASDGYDYEKVFWTGNSSPPRESPATAIPTKQEMKSAWERSPLFGRKHGDVQVERKKT